MSKDYYRILSTVELRQRDSWKEFDDESVEAGSELILDETGISTHLETGCKSWENLHDDSGAEKQDETK